MFELCAITVRLLSIEVICPSYTLFTSSIIEEWNLSFVSIFEAAWVFNIKAH